MAVIAGDAYFDILTVREPDGDPVSGASWATIYAATAGGSGFALNITETASPGTYLIEFTPGEQTSYHRILKATKDGADYIFAGTLHVVSRQLPFEHYATRVAEEVLYLQDGAGDPVTGATFALVSSQAPAGSTFALEQRELATPGGYVVGVTPDRLGIWAAEIESDTDPVQRFALQFVVMGAGSALPVTVLSAPEWGFSVTNRDPGAFAFGIERITDDDFTFAVLQRNADGTDPIPVTHGGAPLAHDGAVVVNEE